MGCGCLTLILLAIPSWIFAYIFSTLLCWCFGWTLTAGMATGVWLIFWMLKLICD